VRKARRATSAPLSVKLPPKRIREKFLIIYELEGCQKAVNYLSKYYGVRRMKIFLNGRKVGKWCLGLYRENCAYFKKEGLTKRIVLHEFYHNLIKTGRYELPITIEEREAERFSREFVKISKAETKKKTIFKKRKDKYN